DVATVCVRAPRASRVRILMVQVATARCTPRCTDGAAAGTNTTGTTRTAREETSAATRPTAACNAAADWSTADSLVVILIRRGVEVRVRHRHDVTSRANAVDRCTVRA
ncbi:unnamed protein product, partial [Sphacelaria rigidula]